jgi:hypothetical protein
LLTASEILPVTRIDDGYPSLKKIPTVQSASTKARSTSLVSRIATYDPQSTDFYTVYLASSAIPDKVAIDGNATYIRPISSLEGWHIYKTTDSSEATHIKFQSFLENDDRILKWERETLRYYQKRLSFSDPLFKNQWHIYNDGQEGAVPGNDINAMDAYAHGYTGSGVIIQFVDDGLQRSHPEFSSKFVANARYDSKID